MNFNNLNPVLFGLIAGIVTYIILFIDVKFENNKFKIKSKKVDGKCVCPTLYVTLKVPLIIGAIIWWAATYFESFTSIAEIEEEFVGGESSPLFEQDLFTDQPDFF